MWTLTSLHPLEYRTTINGHPCVVRVLRVPAKPLQYEAVVYTDTQPVDVSTHADPITAKRHAEATAK